MTSGGEPDPPLAGEAHAEEQADGARSQAAAYRPRVSRGRVFLRPYGTVRVLEADPDLARHLEPSLAAQARRLAIAELAVLARGRWDPAADALANEAGFGCLVLDGMLARRVTVGRRRSVELLGSGDLLRPAQPASDPYAGVAHTAQWTVMAPVRLALIDGDLVSGLAGLEGVLSELVGRPIQRAQELAMRLAICQTPGLEERLELLFWHLADRWGRREAGATVVPLALSQGLLAELACATRSSVNPALKRLADRGIACRHDQGGWALYGAPPPRLLASS